MKWLLFLIEFVAYSLERRRLRFFLRVHGNEYCLSHREEWLHYMAGNWATKMSRRCRRFKGIAPATPVVNKPKTTNFFD